MTYSVGTKVTNQEMIELQCIAADEKTAVFGRILYRKTGEEYISYELLEAYDNTGTVKNDLTIIE